MSCFRLCESFCCDPLARSLHGMGGPLKCYVLCMGLLQPCFPSAGAVQTFCFSADERQITQITETKCIFTTHPITLIPFPAQHPVFLGQECDFIVLTVRSLLIANADFLLVASVLCIVVRCLFVILVKNCLQ